MRDGHVTRARLAYGLACDIEHEDRSMRADLPAREGGSATGPNPGQLMRASLCASLLMGYRIWAGRLGVALDAARVEITCEFDAPPDQAERAAASATPVWSRFRFDVTLVGPAPELELLRVAEAAHRHSAMLALLSDTVEREFRIQVRPPVAPSIRSA